MLLGKPCEYLQQDQRCLRNGSFCDPYCIKMRHLDPNESDIPEEETSIQWKQKFVWFEKGQGLWAIWNVCSLDCCKQLLSDRMDSPGGSEQKKEVPHGSQLSCLLNSKTENGLRHGAIASNMGERGLFI